MTAQRAIRRAIQSSDICVIANPKSGRNSRDAQAIERAMAVLGAEAQLRRWTDDSGLQDEVRRAIADGYRIIVAAGGDGTVTGVAQALLGDDLRQDGDEAGVSMGVLPLGTFNYFARGLGLPQDPEEAARAILNGKRHNISVGSVNGQVFLNNASIGLYPAVLRAREDIYRRWGRSRLMANWSLLRTLIRFQRPYKLTMQADDGQIRHVRTPLIFVARSAYQLAYFGLEGADAIHDDQFAVYVARGGTRTHLVNLALRLATGTMRAGRDIDLIAAREMRIDTAHRRPHVAYDGEKRRMSAPLSFKIHEQSLSIIVPDDADQVAA
ncbi:diacylglycerol/lipid kinase family protein [Pararhodobacter zhoushanensis]|uniref:Diacylglycerol kinase family protein n=1 Tax=Pararhodobacter zhoushanensis TaxID=2479545 RepID=A0ABT3H4F6_9RHOB|nr:diacylglycerol kinase family protein [Pararhodobacter zhoushanensis]MCW1934630.1 diacylglycerol kinase family protein [Pararhodobacter zhoushanensis]